MIGTTEIAQLISSPSNVETKHFETLETLATKHPYSQIFSILLLKGLSSTQSVDFEEKLQNHSFRIGDRIQLFNLIEENTRNEDVQTTNLKETITEFSKTNDIIEENSIEINSNDLKDEITDSSQVETIDNEDLNIDLSEKNHLTEKNNITEEISDSKDENDILKTSEEIIIENPKNQSQDELDKTILQHIYGANYRLPELTNEEESKLEERQTKIEAEITLEENTDSLIQDAENEVDDTIKDTPSSFISWLHADKNFSADNTQTAKTVDEFKEFDPSEALFGEIEKPKKEFFSPIKKAKESLEEETLPISETLAKIYILQGNFPMAISSYEKLSLKYPEKKIFFANLITDLKKKLNTER